MTEQRNPVTDELHRRIGGNLLRLQAMELSLKFVLPYTHPDGGAKGADAMRAYQSKDVTGKPFHVMVSDNGTVIYRADEPVDLTVDGPGALSFSVFLGG
jgi:hypothetical protein